MYFILALLMFVSGSWALAHPGGLDALGCHLNKALGKYECHQGELDGLRFDSHDDAQKALADKHSKAPIAAESSVTETAAMPEDPNEGVIQILGPKRSAPTLGPPKLTKPEKISPPAVIPEDDPALSVISWNVKHLGRKGLDADAIAGMLIDGDIITFQEVNSKANGQEALSAIAARLKAKVNERICMGLSELPTQSHERYAFIWRDTKISYVRVDGSTMETCPDSAIVIRLGVKNAADIVREPAVGTFYSKALKTKFILASIHLVPTQKRPQLEVRPLFDTFKDQDGAMIIAGDYNLDSSHIAFRMAREWGFSPALRAMKTSLKQSERQLNKAYDNFWIRGIRLMSTEVKNLYEHFPNKEQTDIYNNISDHSPILATFELQK